MYCLYLFLIRFYSLMQENKTFMSKTFVFNIRRFFFETFSIRSGSTTGYCSE